MTLPSLAHIGIVACGGAAGSAMRFMASAMVAGLFPESRYPWGTTFVNIIGCALLGFLVELFSARFAVSLEMKLFLLTGFLGGFTTFSAFGLETATLLRSGEFFTAALSVLLQVVLGCGAVFLGGALTRILP
ncbi:MAG: fluoride efflux transporter CrcB [Pseudomonadota bacterium]|jgi:CrcB protein